MPVFRGSRYSEVSVTVLKDARNRVIRFLHSRTPLKQEDLTEPAAIHEQREGDALDHLAFFRSGEENKWHLIADVNEIFWPFDIEKGTKLIIPSAAEFSRRA